MRIRIFSLALITILLIPFVALGDETSESGPGGTIQFNLTESDDIPEFFNTSQIVGHVPPEGEVPSTDQWPVVGRFDYDGVEFCIYAKHTRGYDPGTQTGEFEVWIAPPPSYIMEIEADHPYGASDAYEYLRQTESGMMSACYYPNPGSDCTDPDGMIAWTQDTDRLVVTVLNPPNNDRLPTFPFASYEFVLDGVEEPLVESVHILCYCSNWEDGISKSDDVGWINYFPSQGDPIEIDQWGLPDCSPVR